MACPACAHRNIGTALYCRGCYRPLLGGFYIDEEVEVNGDERFHVLAEACEMARTQNWNLPRFRSWLAAFAADQRMRETNIRNVEIPFGLEDDFAEEQEVGWSGVESCNRGLARLYEYKEDDNILFDGLRMFWKGICLVKEAMQINRSNAARPIWV